MLTRALTHPFAPSTTPVQAATYLLAISLFSISFLVFLNSGVSFVVTDLLGHRDGVGDAVGTLGFADELVALVACPAWGAVSDRLGVRWVSVLGYAVVAVALVVFVQARNLYPELVLARVLFAVGGSAAATMVTAILPSLTDSPTSPSRKPPVLAGYVGFFTGCGALVALVCFLPLPTRFGAIDGVSPAQAVQYSFYVVAGVAALVAGVVAVGLRGLRGEEDKGWDALFRKSSATAQDKPYLALLRQAAALGFSDADIALGYLGGFVARASTVAVSLFIPLLVNTYFISHGFCRGDPGDSSPDLKRECRAAYVLASILTGSAQFVALVCAPLFGYLASTRDSHHSTHNSTSRLRSANWPVISAAAAGVVGYLALPSLASPEISNIDNRGGSPIVFAIMALLGISQIGAIVSSLGSLGKGILGVHTTHPLDSTTHPLLEPEEVDTSRTHLKGSIAGVYSWCGGVAILILTKTGGWLFDVWSVGAPFYLMAGFNGVLLGVAVFVDLRR